VKLAIVVPVKSPRRAKHRLAPILSEPDRERLATTMARDVFQIVAGLWDYGRLVISDDPDVLEEGRRFGLDPLIDRVSQGQSAAVQQIEVVLTPDRDRLGTNGLRLIPPHAITLRFGEDSFNLHRAQAVRAHRSFAVHVVAGLEHDLDRPEDIASFMQLGRDTATLRLLQEFTAAERLLASAPPLA